MAKQSKARKLKVSSVNIYGGLSFSSKARKSEVKLSEEAELVKKPASQLANQPTNQLTNQPTNQLNN